MVARKELHAIATLRAHGLAQNWSIPRIIEAIVDRFGLSRLKAHRLARGWTRPEAIDHILATYHADGLRSPKLSTQRLCAWEHYPQIRPGEDYLDRLCRIYQTRPDLLGYGHDYTVTHEPPTPPAAHAAGTETVDAYAGTPAASLALTEGEHYGAGFELQPASEEVDTDRNQFLRGVGATSLAALLDRAGRATVRLSSKLGASNLGPATLEQLELRVAGLAKAEAYMPCDQLFRAVLAQLEEVEALLDGLQPLGQRRQLYRITGQLSVLLGHLAWDLGDYSAARAHLLTALQSVREVDDYALIARVRMVQSHVELWAGDYRAALEYAEDGQRYATGVERARLAARCEARAYARIGDRKGVIDALQRAQLAMPSQPATDDSCPLWAYTPGDLELHTGISFLWLGDPHHAEPHAKQAITLYQTAPLALQSPPDQAHAQINLAICLAAQDQPDEGIKLANDALSGSAGREANLQQARDFLAALPAQHRDLPATRDFADHLRTLHTPHHG